MPPRHVILICAAKGHRLIILQWLETRPLLLKVLERLGLFASLLFTPGATGTGF